MGFPAPAAPAGGDGVNTRGRTILGNGLPPPSPDAPGIAIRTGDWRLSWSPPAPGAFERTLGVMSPPAAVMQ